MLGHVICLTNRRGEKGFPCSVTFIMCEVLDTNCIKCQYMLLMLVTANERVDSLTKYMTFSTSPSRPLQQYRLGFIRKDLVWLFCFTVSSHLINMLKRNFWLCIFAYLRQDYIIVWICFVPLAQKERIHCWHEGWVNFWAESRRQLCLFVNWLFRIVSFFLLQNNATSVLWVFSGWRRTCTPPLFFFSRNGWCIDLMSPYNPSTF